MTLATGSRFYVELALNLALSLRINDPKRPVCVVIEEGMVIPPEYRPFFDEIIYLESRAGYHGCLNKLRVHELSPFEETMFIDSDCILVKNDMDRHWRKHESEGFMIAGDMVNSGYWYGFSINTVLSVLKTDYMTRMNSGVFYFRRCDKTSSFFELANSLVANHKPLLGKTHRAITQLADEPFIGAAMGIQKLEPINYAPEEGTIMVTTINSTDVSFDPFARTSHLLIHSDFRVLNRFLPRVTVAHSPSLAHFVQLKPKAVYYHISDQLRIHFSLQTLSA